MTAELSESARIPRRRQVRRARATDAGAIAALVDTAEALRQVSPLESFPLDRATVLHWLLQRDAGYVLEDRGEIVAYGELVPDQQRPGRLWIGHMMVHPRRRGLGLGQRLVQELLNIAEHDRNAREVAISAFADNARALRCYEACGFVRVDTEQVEGRPLVGMRRRFHSRQRSPRTLALVSSGLLGLAVAAVVLDGTVRALVTEAPAVLVSVLAQPAAALLAFPLRRERREPFAARLRAAAIRAAVANAAAFVVGLVVVALSGALHLAGGLVLVYATATVVWVGVLAARIGLDARA